MPHGLLPPRQAVAQPSCHSLLPRLLASWSPGHCGSLWHSQGAAARCAALVPHLSHPAGASGNTLNEALCINTSLHFLEMVIVALQERPNAPCHALSYLLTG